MVLASSTRTLPAVAEFVIAAESIPIIASEYAFIASPNGTSFSPKVSTSLFPVKNATTPPVLGTVSASSTKALPAVAELTIASASSPRTASPNAFIASPNGTSCFPNSPISFSPAKNPTTPPEFGMVVAISAMALPAIAASVTAFASSPVIASPNCLIASPNGTSCFPKAVMSFSPAKKDTNPPVFGIVAAISANALPAVAAFATISPSMFPIANEKSLIASPNGTSSSPNLDKDDPPVSQEVNPCKISAAVRISTVSANAFTPSIIDG